MICINYYKEIKTKFLENEAYKKVKDYSKNKNDLNTYYEVGRLLIEAQGGEDRAKYGNQLIKVYSEKLTKELGKGYSTRSLKYMRQFYLMIQKGQAMPAQLSWSHMLELLPLKNMDEIKYYIYITETQNLSYRELRERKKSNEYERIGYKHELEDPKVNTLIKDPIIINTNKIPNKLTEYTLHQFILEDMDNFLKELGIGFMYAGHEVKIKIGDDYHYIDFLFFNVKFNCYVVVEIKITKFYENHVGQILKYMGYIDSHMKEIYHNKTIGIIVCKENNRFVLNYINPDGVYTTTYKLGKQKV